MNLTDISYEKRPQSPKLIPMQDIYLVLAGMTVLLLLMTFENRLGSLQPVRIVLGLTYVLFVPGYCLTTALFPRINDLDRAVRLSLSIGLSIASVPVVALVLDWLDLGLYPWPILVGELGVIGYCIALTLRRRSQLPTNVIYIPGILRRSLLRTLPTSSGTSYILLMCGLLMLALTGWVLLTPTPDDFMTEFYIVGPNGLIADYPYTVDLKDKVYVDVGVVNREKNALSYRYEVWVTNSHNLESRERVVQSDSFTLKPGEQVSFPLSWYMPSAGENQRVELFLYSDHNSEPSQRLRMWVNVRE